MSTPDPPSPLERSFEHRFDRQSRFAALGKDGQERVQAARVLIVGCGALGGFLAQLLVRAGVGSLVLVDRDIVEESNLPRQVLFNDSHAAGGCAKSQAAAETLAAIGGPTRIEAHSAHLDADLLPHLAADCQLILDGTDNLATRYLVNDWSVREGIPWVYGGVVGSGGLVLPILPGEGPCLRCIFREPPPPGSLPTCDTAGVIGPAVGAIASLQAGLALRLLASSPADGEPPSSSLTPALVEIDVWSGETRRINVPRDPACPCCGERDFPWLERPAATEAVSLCGRDTVEVRARGARPDLDRLAVRLRQADSRPSGWAPPALSSGRPPRDGLSRRARPGRGNRGPGQGPGGGGPLDRRVKPALVVLAAGASRRLGECKALVDLNGSSPLERLLRAGGPASHGPVLVVTGAHHGEIAEALAQLRKAPAQRGSTRAARGPVDPQPQLG